MRPGIVPSLLMIALACAGAPAKTPARAQAKRTPASPPYSFLPRVGGSLKGVVRQLEASPVLRQRYANHFHTTPDNVMSFVRQRLVETVIPVTRPYTIWMARADGRKYSKLKTMKKGVRVLALRNGTPILHEECGNPFVSHIKFVPKKYLQKKVKPSSDSRRRYSSVVTPYEKEQGFLAEIPYEAALQTPFADVPMSMMRSNRFIVPFWWGTSGGDSIPEPGTLALIAVGILPMLALIRREKK